MTKEQIEKVVEELLGELPQKLNKILDVTGGNTELIEEYSRYKSRSLANHHAFNTSGAPDEFEPAPTKSLKEFKTIKAGRLLGGEQEAEVTAQELLGKALGFDGDTVAWYELISKPEFIQAEQKLTNTLVELRNSLGLFKRDELVSSVSQSPILSSVIDTSVPRLSFHEYMERFLEASAKGKRPNQTKPWSEKQRKEYFRLGRIFSKHIFPDKTFKDVGGKELDEAFSNVIQSLPLGNVGPYNRMDDAERVQAAINGDVDDDALISPKTVKAYHKFLMSFYEYLYNVHLIEEKAIDRMRLKISDKSNERGAFTDTQVRRIINFANRQDNNNKRWPFLIMACTGMRNGEVMQLRKEDVKYDVESELHYILITPEAGNVKTDAGIRNVPIHNELINLGFIEFVGSSTNGPLFNKDGRFLTTIYANQIKRDCNLPDKTDFGEVLNLYSLRHTVITKLRGSDVNDSKVKQIVGHKGQKSVTDGYTHPFSIAQLKEGIDKISYD